ACFTSGMAVLLPVRPNRRGVAMLAAAVLLFGGFLAKYMLAIYFPFVCLYVLVAARSPRVFFRFAFWFALPLTAGCALYAAIFRHELAALLAFSTTYTDLKSADPLRDYLWDRLDVWVLAAVALLGVRGASARERLVGLGGAAILLGFQAAA